MQALTISVPFRQRLNLWIMMFTCCWAAYMLRVNMSLNIIAMVPHTPKPDTLRSRYEPDDGAMGNESLRQRITHEVPGPKYDWSEHTQALVIGAYFWSYPVSSFFGGTAAESYGPRYTIIATTVMSALLTLLIPLAANWSYIAVIVIRFMLGFTGGFTYPALHALVAAWVPPEEKGKFISSLMGGTLGTVVTWSVTGPLMNRYGWASAFYLSGALALFWCIFWWHIIRNSPAEHPRITEMEKKHILDALGDKIRKAKAKALPPYFKIMTSVPFIAMIVLHYGNMWGNYFIQNAAPKFVAGVLGFDLAEAGGIAALPYLARLCSSFVFGSVGDYLMKKNFINPTVIRKFFCTFSHIIPGILLMLLTYLGRSTALSITMITMSMGFNGAATLTNLQNHQDLAPNYAGTLYGIANAIGSSAGFVTPLITAHFTATGHTYDNWGPILLIGGGVYIVSAIFFIIFGTAKTQVWNSLPAKQSTPTLKDTLFGFFS